MSDVLDDFLSSQPASIHRSDRRLFRLVREAYPIGIPALIMKSNTDRMTASSGYTFILGTPDEILRRLASWLFTNSTESHDVLLALVGRLWKRHGREDVALAAIILANLDHVSLGIEPWKVLRESIGESEPLEGLLLNIEELLRAGRGIDDEKLENWLKGRLIDAHLSLVTSHAKMVRGEVLSPTLVSALSKVEVPDGDSLLTRIKQRIAENSA